MVYKLRAESDSRGIIPVAADDNDKQVFKKLRQAYKEIRGWWRVMASIHTLAEIRYVKVSYSTPSYVSVSSRRTLV